jgi:hypothetical protein
MVNSDIPARLTRRQAAQYLAANGYPITERYFEKLCVPGSDLGPKIDCWFGNRALYLPADLISWAQARCRPGRGVSAG